MQVSESQGVTRSVIVIHTQQSDIEFHKITS